MGKGQPKSFETVERLCCCLKLDTGMLIVARTKLIFSSLLIIASMWQIALINYYDESQYILYFHIKNLGETSKFLPFLSFEKMLIKNAFIYFLYSNSHRTYSSELFKCFSLQKLDWGN